MATPLAARVTRVVRGAFAHAPPFEILASGVIALVASTVEIAAVPGIESAAVFGVLLPPLLAGATALRTSAERRAGVHDAAFSVARALVLSTFAFATVLGIAVARQLVDPACFAWDGVPWLVFGPAFGMVLAALVGEMIGRVVPGPRLAATLASLIPLAALGVVVAEIWATPAVFAFTIFGGHWPGPIYDESTDFPTTLLTYRAVTTLLLVALVLGLRFGPRPAAVRRANLRPYALGLAGLCTLAFGVLTIEGARFGHRTSVARIDEALGGIVRGRRCVLHVPSEMPGAERRRTLAECELHVEGVERALMVRRRAPLHAFVYRSADEKGSLIGASETYVAKPWRGEVHVQRAPFPHPVLRHEIVHVIAAEIGPFPFRAAGALGGLVTNPALVEGLAVALAPETRDGLSADEWSRAMLELGHLPSAAALAGSGFLGQGAAASYSASGSFIGHVLRVRGAKAMHRMYGHGRLGGAAAITQLERSWHAHLRSLALPPQALELTRLRLEDRGLFSTRCARLRARIGERIAAASGRRDHRRALARCRELLAIDRRDSGARITEVIVLARGGRSDAAEWRLARIDRDRRVPAPLRARAHTVLGDQILSEGGAGGARMDPPSRERARRHYHAALSVPQGEDSARAIEVRLAALDRERSELTALFDAIRDSTGPETEARVVLALEAARAHARDGLVSYVLARRLANADEPGAALPLFHEAEVRGLPSARIEAENTRMIARAAASSMLAGDAFPCDDVRRYEALRTRATSAAESETMLAFLRREHRCGF